MLCKNLKVKIYEQKSIEIQKWLINYNLNNFHFVVTENKKKSEEQVFVQK